jgi:hypothetical protein
MKEEFIEKSCSSALLSLGLSLVLKLPRKNN